MEGTCEQRKRFKESGNKKDTYTYNRKEAAIEISGTHNEKHEFDNYTVY